MKRPTAPHEPNEDCREQDQILLMRALSERLRSATTDRAISPLTLQAALLDAAAALEALLQAHGGLRQHGRRLEQQLAATRQALRQAREELVCTRAGERQARHLAEHDGLTLLPNRNLFQTRLQHALHDGDPAAAPLAVLYLDLDDFKPINDRHGHETGDEILRIVAQRLSRAIRAGDLVCRLGGDEFACLLANTMDRAQLTQLAAKLFDAVSAPLKLGPLELRVRPSIGIAVYPDDGRSAGLLLKRADRAMYRAKREHLGYAFYDGATGD